MKFCTKCGVQLFDEAVICPKCGCPAGAGVFSRKTAGKDSSLATAAKVFMYINLFALIFINFACSFILDGGLFLLVGYIPLCWGIPMAEVYSKKIKNGEQVGTGFKVCTLLFVSLIAGVLMLCDENN